MKASKYNIFVDQNSKGEFILYNTLYGSLSILNPKEINIVKQILDKPYHYIEGERGIRNVLAEQKFLIEDDVDEIKIIENRKLRGINDENRLDIVLLPTIDCNLSCVYCYEEHHAQYMNDVTEYAIDNWLKNQIPQYKVTMIHWYGGEPLMAYQRIVSITQRAMQIASNSDNFINLQITTNGYLLNEKRCRELIEIGIKNFQITLDGTQETHDKLRILKNGKGTFKRIFNNIVLLAKTNSQVKISLRINFNHNNLHTIPQLLEMFPKSIRPQLRVVYEPIFGPCYLNAADNLHAEEISTSIANYYALAEELGYDVILGQACLYTGRLVYCYAERKNQLIINYNGDTYKCSVGKFYPEERVGYIQTDGSFVKEESQWNKWVEVDLFEKDCYNCIYLPLCMGGCRKARMQKNKTGSYCKLVPTNTLNILKHVAYGSFEDLLRKEGSVSN